MEITHKNMIAGVRDKGVEFYAVAENTVHAFHDGSQWACFKSLPDHIHTLLRNEMGVQDAPLDKLESFVFKEMGGLDSIPDIDENGNINRTEFFLDHNEKFDNGTPITGAQLRVLQLIEFTVLEISGKLYLSGHTVARHIQDMLKNSGIPTAKALAAWATKKGII